jgi:hypothetical protein
MAYPRAKNVIIDFIGWEHDKLVNPRKSNRSEPPARFAGRFSSVIIRGLHGEQQEYVSQIVNWYVMPNNGRVGTTSSHFSLVAGGTLVEVTPGMITWRSKETIHPLLEDEPPALGALTIGPLVRTNDARDPGGIFYLNPI